MKEFKPQILTFKSTEVGHGLENIAQNVLVHIKSNQKVYIQVGKVCLYATITATGLFFDSITGYASGTWADEINTKAESLYNGLVAICQWVIIGKAIWDMAVACIHGEMRKAPSIGISYSIVVGILYAMPILMNAIKNLFVG